MLTLLPTRTPAGLDFEEVDISEDLAAKLGAITWPSNQWMGPITEVNDEGRFIDIAFTSPSGKGGAGTLIDLDSDEGTWRIIESDGEFVGLALRSDDLGTPLTAETAATLVGRAPTLFHRLGLTG